MPLTTLNDILEDLMDQYGQTVIDALADVCSEKADHARSAWQDEVLAILWERAAHNLYKIDLPY